MIASSASGVSTLAAARAAFESLDSPTGWVFTIRAGKIVRSRGSTLDPAVALEIAGLSE